MALEFYTCPGITSGVVCLNEVSGLPHVRTLSALLSCGNALGWMAGPVQKSSLLVEWGFWVLLSTEFYNGKMLMPGGSSIFYD